MQTPPAQPRQLLPPRHGARPVLTGHSAPECAQLDAWPADWRALGWLFDTDKNSDLGLLKELNRGRTQLRALSLLDVLDVLDQARVAAEQHRTPDGAEGGRPQQQARVRVLLEAQA